MATRLCKAKKAKPNDENKREEETRDPQDHEKYKSGFVDSIEKVQKHMIGALSLPYFSGMLSLMLTTPAHPIRFLASYCFENAPTSDIKLPDMKSDTNTQVPLLRNKN